MRKGSLGSRGELIAVGLFALASGLAFAGKAFHVDETVFLAVAAQILRDPRHPLGFAFNWVGVSQPVESVFNHSLLTPYSLALAARVTGGGEAPMRAVCLPVDVTAAGALYVLAARFLRRPLWPVLIILAGPAWFIGMPLLMAEKGVVCFSLLSVCALLAGLDRESAALYWLSAALVSLAVVLKHTAVFMLAPLAVVQLRRGVPPRRIAAYVLAAALPVALDAAWLEPNRLRGTWDMSARVDHSFAGEIRRLRALAAFPAGCAVVLAWWPFLRGSSPRSRVRAIVLGSLAAAAVLFLPALDLPGETIRPFDRLFGIFLACAGFTALCRLCEPKSRALPGWPLWAAWVLGGFAVAGANWFVSARALLLFLPALLLAGAERLEAERSPRALDAAHRVSFGAVLCLSLALGLVDARFAGAQRSFAAGIKAREIDRGRKVWFTGHWGFQYYMEQAGASALDASRGGWSQARPGDLVVIPRTNTNQILPPASSRASVAETTVDEAIPLRLMNLGSREAGFYASPFGFLPYTVSLAPLDVFSLVEIPPLADGPR